MQLIMLPALQAPLPSHVPPDVNVPAVQEAAAPQPVVLPGNTQLFRF
jgi:hypothetical protein